MINKIIDFSIENRIAIGALTIVIIVAGIWSMNKVPIDAVPDITNNQVQIITQAPNLGTVDIEQFVTFPVELELSNLPGVTEIRSISRFGLSVVTVVFEDNMGTYLPRQLVQEKLETVRAEIPKDFGSPSMGPISTGLGEIYQYTLEVDPKYKDKYSLTDLRSFQDWIVRRQMAMVPGVVEVNGFGGNIKQYEIAIHPEKLKSMGLTIGEVFTALEKNNENTGGAYIVKNHQANFIRGEGLIRNLDDIRSIRIKNMNDIPIFISDVADVKFGKAVRYGAFTKNGQGEAVGGMALMLKGENSNDVIENVKKRVKQIQSSLPEGIKIVPFLDRSELIKETTSTVFTNLIEGGLIVIFVLVLFLGNWRGGLIVASTIPLSLLFAFILMNWFGVWANLMSLGAIDFGIIVDGAVIIVESTVFGITQKIRKTQEQITPNEMKAIAKDSSKKMMNSAFFGQLIILLVFIPILSLEGVEGKMFKPMALTFSFAMLGALILCLTYVPMMSATFLKSSTKVGFGDKLVLKLENLYGKVLRFVLKKAKIFIVVVVAVLGFSIYIFSQLGGEFIPQLDEGDLAFHVILKPGSSLEEAIKTSTRVEGLILKKFPEVKDILTKFGVSEIPTDPMPMEIGDCIVKLKPRDEWTSASSKDELITKMKAELETIPGINYEFTQPIEMRFNDLLTGVRQDIAIKIFGEDLNVLAKKAQEVSNLIKGIDGIGDMSVEATTGLSQITVKYNRQKMARYDLDISDLNNTLKTAFAGGKAGVIFEGEKRYDMVVRLDKSVRTNIDDVRYLYVNTPDGTQVPLSEVAEIEYNDGPMQISRDNTNRRVYVGINVRDRDIESLVKEIQTKLEAELDLPPGYNISYGGAFENLERAMNRLKVVIPAVLLLIFILIYFALKSFKYTSLIFFAIPFAAIGGVLSLWSRGLPFSISAGVGFIVLFGVAVLNGLVLLNGFQELKDEYSTDINKRIMKGTKRRVRPILLTALTDILGFFPMAVSMSSGAEVQRPLATVVIGGLFTSTILTLFLLPIMYRWIETRKMKTNRKIANTAIAVVALLIFSANSTFAQSNNTKQITMEEAINLAKEHYPQLKIKEHSITKASKQSKKSLDFGQTQIFTGVEEAGNGNAGVQSIIGFGQNNIDIFSSFAKSDYYQSQEKLAQIDYNLTELQLSLQVSIDWMKVATAVRHYEFYRQFDSLFIGISKNNSAKYDLQDISGLEYSITKSKSNEVANQLQISKTEVEQSIIQLNKWLPDDNMYIADASTRYDTMKVAELELNQLHPYLEYYKQNIAVSQSQLDMSYSELYPKLYGNYAIQDIQGQKGFYSYQVGISFPLFFNSVSGDIGAAEQEYMIAEQTLELKEMEFTANYKYQLLELKKWENSFKYYEAEAMPLVEDIKEKSFQRYKNGEIDYTDFVQSIREVIDIEANYINAMKNYYNSYINLKYYTN